MFRNTQSVY